MRDPHRPPVRDRGDDRRHQRVEHRVGDRIGQQPLAEQLGPAAAVRKQAVPEERVEDAGLVLDAEQIEAVGVALWERCDSILTVTAAHYGQAKFICNAAIFWRRMMFNLR